MTKGRRAASRAAKVARRPTSPDSPRDSLSFLDFVVFLVECRFFKVPKYHFTQNSEAFASCFSLPQGDNVEGTNEENPFRLDGISKIDFKSLLKVMYPLDIPSNLSLATSEWVAVLKLSTLYCFVSARLLAIEKLTGIILDPIERVCLAKTYHVPKWFRSALAELARRTQHISLDDAEQLEFRTSILLYQVREEYIRAYGPSGSMGGYSYYNDTVDSSINRLFADNIRDLERADAVYTQVPIGMEKFESEFSAVYEC
ncbi:hypothetical protein BDQ12DRAFT_642272 [Crucibulum laeve]|uniref:BTB domain-containing protein n=1 Tax=Crucibulum laeve TaxID=68775 RepID=A0A5C3MUN5_9AGAR|nr:hypothetical protein BDQ12DRAFT_642272 [Crucibulum laeve]